MAVKSVNFQQSVAPIYDLYDDEIEQVTIDIVEDESLIFDCPIYDTEALTHSQKSGSEGRELFYWLSSIHSEKEDHTDDIIRETPVCVSIL